MIVTIFYTSCLVSFFDFVFIHYFFVILQEFYKKTLSCQYFYHIIQPFLGSDTITLMNLLHYNKIYIHYVYLDTFSHVVSRIYICIYIYILWKYNIVPIPPLQRLPNEPPLFAVVENYTLKSIYILYVYYYY